MTKYYSEKMNGFFDNSVHTKLPIDAIEIPDDLYAALLAGQGGGREIKANDKGFPILVDPLPPNLEEMRETLKKRVDAAAEKECQKYSNEGSGQMAIYREKADQAVAYSKKWFEHKTSPETVPEPNENDYLLLKAGIGIEGDTMIEVAALITQTYAEWQVIGAAIEGVRLKTKMAISEAKTAEEAQAIFAAIEWPK